MSDNNPLDPLSGETPQPPFMSPEEPVASAAVASDLKPLRWLPAGLISLLSGILASLATFAAAILFIGLPVLIGVLAKSVTLGIAIAIPMLIGMAVFSIYCNVRFTRWLLGAFDYQAPAFWQTLLALWLGTFAATALNFILGLILGLGIAASLGSNGADGSVVALQGVVMLLSLVLQVVCIGFALSKIDSIEEATAKKASIIIASVITAFIVIITVIIAAVAIPRFNEDRDSANNSAAISSIREGENALNTYFNLNNETFGKSPEALVKALSQDAVYGREKGLTWVVAGQGAELKPSGENDSKTIFIESVTPGRFGGVSFCVGSKGTKNYCGAVLGNDQAKKWTLKGNNNVPSNNLAITPGSPSKVATSAAPVSSGGSVVEGWDS